MTIYQNDVTEIRLNTGIDLSTATSFVIKCQKPSGIQVDWNASRYLTTSYITYTTSNTDLAEAGNYILQSYILWDGVPGPLGDATIVTVEAPFTIRINVPDIINIFNIYYRFLSVQTLDEYNDNENLDADILYEHFETFSDLALDELDMICTARMITLTATQEKVALCHLVADFFEQGNPDWSFRSQSQAPGVSFSRGDKTGPRAALDKMLDIIEIASRRSMVTKGRGANTPITRIKDAKQYPIRWKRTDIPAYDGTESGFDSSEVGDMGVTDTQSNAW
jgi:hypothetical protein